ncbi:hypothetical protein BDZ45DRAFT_684168 [Acephala macrosclerotiorum]|nr:hypothetical protein BDZ45DRAFT_684168 [Acephala macrosclerotiorum]
MDSQVTYNQYNAPTRALGPAPPSYLLHVRPEYDFPIDPTILAEESNTMPKVSQVIQQSSYPPASFSQYQPHFTGPYSSSIFENQPAALGQQCSTRNRVEAADSTKQRTDYALPRVYVKEHEMFAIRPGYAFQRLPTFKGRPQDAVGFVVLTLSEVEALNRLRTQNGGQLVGLKYKKDDEAFQAARRINSQKKDENFKKLAERGRKRAAREKELGDAGAGGTGRGGKRGGRAA